MPAKINSALVERLIELNIQAFGSEDPYSDPKSLTKFLKGKKNSCLLHAIKNKVVGYYLLRNDRKAIHGERLAVDQEHRNKKIGARLIRRAIKHAHGAGKPLLAHAHRDNLVSLNLHLKLGMKLTKVADDFLYLST